MKKFLRNFFILLILLGVGVVCYVAYLGFFPRFSSLLGSSKQRDLGIRFSENEYKAYEQKSKAIHVLVKEPVSADKSIRFEGTNKVNDNFLPEEISAYLSMSPWKYMPLSDTQVQIDNDGNVQLSAYLRTDRLSGFVQAVGGATTSRADVENALSFVNKLGSNPPLYAKFKADVTENNLKVTLFSLQIGRFNIPLVKLHAEEGVNALGNFIMQNIPGFYAKSVTFSESKMHFEGNLPAKILVSPK